MTPAALAELSALHERMQQQLAGGQRGEVVATNRVFHARICAVSTNRRAHETLRQLWNYTYRVRRAHPQSVARVHQTMEEHAAILRALAAHDAEAAEQLVRRHAGQAGAELAAHLGETTNAAGAETDTVESVDSVDRIEETL
jgi:DNA-binding GntR family transcriptional regulator